eukprot:1583489-Alexandrium_andersonii.AAC.1
MAVASADRHSRAQPRSWLRWPLTAMRQPRRGATLPTSWSHTPPWKASAASCCAAPSARRACPTCKSW